MTFKELYDEVKRISPTDAYVTVKIEVRRYSTANEDLDWEIYTDCGKKFFVAPTPEEALKAYKDFLNDTNLSRPRCAPTEEGFKDAEVLP